jgi:hypothetical protein
MKRHCGGWPIPFAVSLHSHAELSQTPTAPVPRCRSPLVCSQTLLARTGTRHDPPCRPPLVCSQTQPCFRRSKPEIGLTLARSGGVRLLLHGRGTCPIRQPSQAYLRVIVAQWGIAASSGGTWREWPGTLGGIVAPSGIGIRSTNHSRSGQAHWRVMVAMWGIAARAAAKHGRSARHIGGSSWRRGASQRRAAEDGGSARHIGG